jgi:hypothetical protein
MRKLMRSALVAVVSAAAVVAGTTAPRVAAARYGRHRVRRRVRLGPQRQRLPGAVGDGTNINRPTPVPLSALPDNVKRGLVGGQSGPQERTGDFGPRVGGGCIHPPLTDITLTERWSRR